MIDRSEDNLNAVSSQIDVFTITGDAKSVEIMEHKLIESCDLLIAVTSSEETNMLICILGKKLGAKRTIARINDVNLRLEWRSRVIDHEGDIDGSGGIKRYLQS